MKNDNMDENALLKTIKITKNLLVLENQLPKAKYENPTEPCIAKVEKLKSIQNTIPTNNTLLLPSINKPNNRYSNVQNLKIIRKKQLNIITDNTKPKKENIIHIKSKSKESVISSQNSNLISYLNNLPLNDNKSNNNIKKERHRKIIIPTLKRPKKGMNKGLSDLYRLYVSSDLIGKNENNGSNKFALYLPNVYARKKGNEKRTNNNSYIGSNILKSKKKLSPLNTKD